jgi:two-component system, cell cycle sensor histidine kinase and response regulator CckA
MTHTSRPTLGAEWVRNSLLAELFETVVAATSETQALNAAARAAADWIGEMCAIAIRSDDGLWADIAAVQSTDPEVARLARELSRDYRLHVGEGVAGRVIASGEPILGSLVAPAEAANDDYAPFIAQFPFRSFLAVPMRMREEVIGCLLLARTRDEEPYTGEDLDFMTRVALRIALVYDSLRSHRIAVAEATRARLLAEFFAAATQAGDERSVLEELAARSAEAVEADCIILKAAPDGERLDLVAVGARSPKETELLRSMVGARPWRSGEGMAGRAFKEGKTLFASYFAPAERDEFLASLPPDRRGSVPEIDLRAVIAVPLESGGKRIGAFTLSRYGTDARPFDASDRAFAEAIAGRANVALSRLLEGAERERAARETRMLAGFLEVVAGPGVDEDEIFVRLAEAASVEMGDWCVVKLIAPDGESMELRAVAARDPELAEEMRALYKTYGLRLAKAADRDIIASGKATLVHFDRAELQQRIADGYASLVARASGEALVVPLRLDGRVAGDIALYRDQNGTPYGEADLRFIEDLSRRACLSVERRRAERAQHEALARLDAVMAASPIATLMLDRESRVVIWNQAAEAMFGWTEAEVKGKQTPIIPADLQAEVEDLRRRSVVGEGSADYETRRLRRDGTEIDVALYAAPFGEGETVGGTVLSFLDLTVRKGLEAARDEATAELRRTSETLKAILEASPLPVIAADEHANVTFWNRAATELYGWTAAEVIGGPMPLAPDEDPTYFETAFARVEAGDLLTGESRRKKKSGVTIEVRIHVGPMYDETGRFTGVLGVHEDITDRKRLEAELLQAQKMETVGRLAGGVAHDFNNILTAIIGYSELARLSTREPDVLESLGTIKSAAERAAALTQQLLAFSRRQALRPQVIEANEVVLGLERIVRRLIGEHVEFVATVRHDAGSILVDRTQLEQVILNLAVNARDAMPGGGQLTIGTGHLVHTGDGGHLGDRGLDLAAGEYVVISVADTGTGMDDETKARIFEPFFTTKDVGKGTGLGLATTEGFVAQSGGKIEVSSELGQGTTFRIYLPAVATEARPEPDQPALRAGVGRVLVAEDEKMLRDLAERVLVRAGFRVILAASPAEAIAEFDRGRAPIDLLITDMVMPGMNGTRLAAELRARQPSLPVLFMSGYDEEMGAQRGPGTAFLGKPFDSNGLLAAVEALLDGAAGK